MDRLRRIRRCMLFVPATRPALLDKALATGADAVCIDLEDSVADQGKAEARASAMALLRTIGEHSAGEPLQEQAKLNEATEIILRINQPLTPIGMEDLVAVCDLDCPPHSLLLPKIDEPQHVTQVVGQLARAASERGWDTIPALIPTIETVRGLGAVMQIAACSPSVDALFFGGIDLAHELGAVPEWEPLLHARSRTIHAAALNRIPTIDTPRLELDAPDQLDGECAAARALGFCGKAAIHPNQVPIVLSAFSPSKEEVDRARRIVAAHEEREEGVFKLDGLMVDRPVIEAAKRTLRLAAHPHHSRETGSAGQAGVR